jgi:limonene 1,2-monooxygenase
MDRANYRVMAPFHIAETREKAIENVRAGFEKWQLYSYSVNPEGGAAIGMPSIEEINEGGRGAIGTPDDALRVLENYWAKTGGFGCILMLAHDWADWEATKHSYELFARYVLPRFEERSAWRSQSMDWMRANRESFSVEIAHIGNRRDDDYKQQTAQRPSDRAGSVRASADAGAAGFYLDWLMMPAAWRYAAAGWLGGSSRDWNSFSRRVPGR